MRVKKKIKPEEEPIWYLRFFLTAAVKSLIASSLTSLNGTTLLKDMLQNATNNLQRCSNQVRMAFISLGPSFTAIPNNLWTQHPDP